MIDNQSTCASFPLINLAVRGNPNPKCLTTIDETERNGYLAEFQDICREYVPIIVLFCRATTVFANPKIEFVGLHIMGTLEYSAPYEANYLG